MARPESISGVGRYKVGTVARLTGLSTHLIRAWERRYGAVSPRRSEAGTRLYGDDDVAKLQLLKALVDLGEPVGLIARLPGEALRRRLQERGEAQGVRGNALQGRGSARLALLAPELAAQIRANPTALGGLEVVLDSHEPAPYLAGLADADPDVLVLSLDAVGADPLDALERCTARVPGATVVVLHGFAPRRLLDALGERGARLAQLPVRLALLRRIVLDHRDIRRASALRGGVALPPPPISLAAADAPAPRFDGAQLAGLLEARSSVGCECPNHLARIVRQLLDFERYSRRCVAEQPRDADLHRLLACGSGHARRQMEELLARVCEHDGIPIPAPQPASRLRAD